jgi:hypothetical protein
MLNLNRDINQMFENDFESGVLWLIVFEEFTKVPEDA